MIVPLRVTSKFSENYKDFAANSKYHLGILTQYAWKPYKKECCELKYVDEDL